LLLSYAGVLLYPIVLRSVPYIHVGMLFLSYGDVFLIIRRSVLSILPRSVPYIHVGMLFFSYADVFLLIRRSVASILLYSGVFLIST
jgi:hypothetical protein